LNYHDSSKDCVVQQSTNLCNKHGKYELILDCTARDG